MNFLPTKQDILDGQDDLDIKWALEVFENKTMEDAYELLVDRKIDPLLYSELISYMGNKAFAYYCIPFFDYVDSDTFKLRLKEEDVDTYMSFYGLNNIFKRYIKFFTKDDYFGKYILLRLIKLYPFCISFVFNICKREQKRESDKDSHNKILYKELCENYNELKSRIMLY